MSLINTLPLELENIIGDFKEQMEQMEHKQKFKSTLDEINKIRYRMNGEDSWRSYGITSVQYYGGLNDADTLYDSIHELWVHTYETTPPYMNGDLGEEIETITTIYESIDYVEIEVDTEERELIDIDDI